MKFSSSTRSSQSRKQNNHIGKTVARKPPRNREDTAFKETLKLHRKSPATITDPFLFDRLSQQNEQMHKQHKSVALLHKM